MMNAFKSSRGCVLLAVQGGRFSEGEDFPGDEMDVSIVVGLPLPPPSPTMYAEYRQMEIDRFDKHQAYMVLSLLPALRKAFQCAGRHVREPGKVGMVFFMDSRFADQRIIDLMPSWLREDLLKGEFGPESISSLTRDFFSSARESLNWVPLRNAILAAASWSLVAPIAPRLPAGRPRLVDDFKDADGGSLSRSERANLSEDFGSPPPILTESDECGTSLTSLDQRFHRLLHGIRGQGA